MSTGAFLSFRISKMFPYNISQFSGVSILICFRSFLGDFLGDSFEGVFLIAFNVSTFSEGSILISFLGKYSEVSPFSGGSVLISFFGKYFEFSFGGILMNFDTVVFRANFVAVFRIQSL